MSKHLGLTPRSSTLQTCCTSVASSRGPSASRLSHGGACCWTMKPQLLRTRREAAEGTQGTTLGTSSSCVQWQMLLAWDKGCLGRCSITSQFPLPLGPASPLPPWLDSSFLIDAGCLRRQIQSLPGVPGPGSGITVATGQASLEWPLGQDFSTPVPYHWLPPGMDVFLECA